MTEFKPNDYVYSKDGVAAKLVAIDSEGYLVRKLWQHEESEEEILGDIETWTKCYSSPPTEVLHEESMRLQLKIDEQKADLRKTQSEINELNRDAADRMERIKRHKGLEELDSLLSGEITHYVAVHDYMPSVRIIPIGDTIEDYCSSNGYGVLSLTPQRDRRTGRIMFSVTYRERKSGGRYSQTNNVTLCRGEDHAKAVAAECLGAIVADYAAKKPEQRSYFDALVSSCATYGVEVPKSMIDEMRDLSIRNMRERLEKIRADAAAIEAEIKEKTQAP